ncbi:unnamed protein product, partial [Rotaria sp. Silwood1]
MFKKDKRPADKTSTFYNGSSSPLVERKEKTPSPISSNFEETNKEVASSSSQSTTEPVSWDTLDPFSVFDVSSNIFDRWLQQLLSEFLEQRDHFKHRLGEKWQNQELTNIKYDDNSDRIRKINNVYKELERARDTILSRESFDELNNYLRIVDDTTRDEIKEKFNLLLQDYFRILQCLRFIDREIKSSNADNNINDIKKNLL